MILLALAVAAAADPLPSDADVVAKTVVPASAEVVYDWLLDVKNFHLAAPNGCVSDWEFGSVTRGVGASVQLTYHAANMHRRLTATMSRAEAPRLVELDHAGRKGFVTRWTLESVGDGTSVEMHTWINPPPWPFRKYYFHMVRPAWVACQEQTLAYVASHVRGNAAVTTP
jgi:hypothetical protein